ncbi:ras guanyl-releasing protein 3-like isoform X1 [Oryzias melastigma]|uniref:ras guanyl-releasing protein 3-like isoform X1 n=1 Tax=Oryzias melastigma TaxID=30732 RepID=UPI00168D157B|nr:ras guanyl-releasing protein 3-like isoform X1 [Oryzias melastigma]
MTELVSSSNNYSCYRKAFNECRGFKIPILGVHLKDLIAVHVVFPDWVGDSNKINLVKMHQLYMTFNELVSLQGAVAHVEPNMDLIYLLTLSLDLYYTEDEIYELSLLREPRNPKSQPTSPTTPNKPLVPLYWASGVTTKPDPSVVNKHIRKVVDVRNASSLLFKSKADVSFLGNNFFCSSFHSPCSGTTTTTTMVTSLRKTLKTLLQTSHFWTPSVFWTKISECKSLFLFQTASCVRPP